jgi:hypothetical protein
MSRLPSCRSHRYASLSEPPLSRYERRWRAARGADYLEVRYFHPSDKEQAERIAEFMRFKLSAPTLAASQYQDPKVNPGYIEVWLGR